MNYTAGGTGKGQGFPHSLVAVGGEWGSEAKCFLDKAYEIWSQFLCLCCLILPYNPAKKRQPSTAGLAERHFQSPVERSRTRTRNLMYSNRAFVITWDCMSEINCKESKCFFRIWDPIVVFITLPLFAI